MKALVIPSESRPAAHLVDLLELTEPHASASRWLCRHVECIGGAAAHFHRASNEGSAVAGSDMIMLARGIQRVIADQFEAFKEGQLRPWLVIHAADGAEYAVITDDVHVMNQIRRRYQSAEDAPALAASVERGDGLVQTVGTLTYSNPGDSERNSRQLMGRIFPVAMFLITPLLVFLGIFAEYAAYIAAFGAHAGAARGIPFAHFPLPGKSLPQTPVVWWANCLIWSAGLSFLTAWMWVTIRRALRSR